MATYLLTIVLIVALMAGWIAVERAARARRALDPTGERPDRESASPDCGACGLAARCRADPAHENDG